MSQRRADAPFQAARGDSLGCSMPQHRCKPHKTISIATCRPCRLALPRSDRPAQEPHNGHQHRCAAHYRHSAVASSSHCGVARGFLPQGLSNACPHTGAVRSVVAARGQASNKPKRERSFTDHVGKSEPRRQQSFVAGNSRPTQGRGRTAASEDLELALPTQSRITLLATADLEAAVRLPLPPPS